MPTKNKTEGTRHKWNVFDECEICGCQRRIMAGPSGLKRYREYNNGNGWANDRPKCDSKFDK